MPHRLANPDHIFDSVADGIFTVDARMRITSFNHAAEKLTGYLENEVIGKACYDIFRTDACHAQCPLQDALNTDQEIIHRDIEIRDRHDNVHAVMVSAAPLRDDHGECIGGVETLRLLSSDNALEKEARERYSFQNMLSRNPQMRHLFDILPDIAASEATVRIQGESGTGKELVAQALHNLSSRSAAPLVVINCGALPEQLLEAEIFGARRGAYTGAVENRPGRLEMAEGGTLFLDEIGDLPLPLQVKLLRVLENREFQPLGAKQSQKANVRFVTATNCDLERMVEEGNFRRDLFFRINVVPLPLPPLRERNEDIPLLIDMALDRFSHQYGKLPRRMSSAALQLLMKHDYPGNVRELLNIVEQAVILCNNGEIKPEHLPSGFSGKDDQHRDPLPANRRPDRKTLQKVLEQFDGNRGLVAQTLGIDRTTLWRWMKKYQLT